MKRSCIEVGWEYSDDAQYLDVRSDVTSVYECLNICRQTSGCDAVSWETGDLTSYIFADIGKIMKNNLRIYDLSILNFRS